MYEVSSQRVRGMESVLEASALNVNLAPGVESKQERRLRAWRKVAAKFSFYRICELDRASPRVRVSADELETLRAATGRKCEAEIEASQHYRELLARIEKLERRLAERRAHVDRGAGDGRV